VEAVKADGGSAAVRVFWLSGHPYGGWRKEGSAAFDLSAGAYRRLTTLVDHYLLTYRLPTREENGETMVCTDGPEALTERVRDGKVTTLSGSCPRDEHEAHPNIHIQAAMLSLACPAITRSVPKDRRQRQACARWQKIAARDRRLIRAEAGTRR
jgi:hypothetical protein